MRKKLQEVFETKVWRGSAEGGRSGPGSTMEATESIRAALPGVLARYGVGRFLDAPCGDWHWMQTLDLSGIDYTGGDIAAAVVAENEARFAGPGVRFMHLDITSDTLPAADMMMCRDCLFHLKNRFRWEFFRNFAASDIPWLMMTMHHLPGNRPLGAVGQFAAFSPQAAPFHFPPPVEMVHEGEPPPADITTAEKPWVFKSMGIWPREAVAEVVARHGGADDED